MPKLWTYSKRDNIPLEKKRRRRSKNSGIRRFLHLCRKEENEKYFWHIIVFVPIFILVIALLWQFIFMKYWSRARENIHNNSNSRSLQSKESSVQNAP